MKRRVSFLVAVTLATLPFTNFAKAEDFSAISKPVARGAQSDESVYFVMTDRFENGDSTNDSAGLTGGRLASGYEPTEPGWWHGGDLKGLTQRLGYIHDMGFSAIWITPPVKQQYFQGSSAAYHGYWGIDFTTVDPHLGTEADFKEMVSAAHKLGMKVIMDVVANHTADVIYYKLNATEYLDSSKFPYKTAAGKPFDPSKVAGLASFPQLNASKSFPYVPLVAPFSKNIKKPNWLNDLNNYHNRGDSTFSGPSMMDGDFFGLDDLFTEKPEVVKGWTDVWTTWITKFGIDGLRIDTFRHVNPEFWRSVIPAVLKVAKSEGKSDFPIFGEVADSNPQILSDYLLTKQAPSVLDFGFQKNISSFVKYGSSGNNLAEFFNSDDLYTTATTSAYGLATFLGNHDMGRIGMQLAKAVPTGEPQILLERAKLANAALFFLRGGPVLYYGDEKGMIGTGGDRLSRQDMFATQVEDWKSEERIGQAPIGTASSFDVVNPLQTQIAEIQRIIKENPALRYGTEQVRSTSNGLLVVTRYLDGQEYLVALNGSDESKDVNASVETADGSWSSIAGMSGSATSVNRSLTFNLPGRSYVVLKADQKYLPEGNISVTPIRISSADFSSTLKVFSVKSNKSGYLSVTFAYRKSGAGWTTIGTSDHTTVATDQTEPGLYRVYFDPTQITKSGKYEVIAVAKDAEGKFVASPIKEAISR